MTVSVTPHLNFRGQAREALAFYRSVFGGDVALATYADTHQVDDPAQADAVSFGRLTAPNGFSIMAYDVQTAKPYDAGRNPFYLTLHGDDQAEISEQWRRLADGGTVLTDLGPSPFAPLYGMLTDMFGTTWIIGCD
ncbi:MULTISPECIES: VOC family protein [unclassified Rathayibacter]|uniref:VOC family protein n=1 Tax=unclassified Rathayibacter TaxID=2609250 RepID=UPI000F4CFA26|nr:MULTISPECIES: VOC family protein [unclassified Rathayibacter]MCJ1705515.1 VOC family protein [Rathayibacter sp. VKM Ac-2926]ROP50180.1 PhnB protein [Rathayibacter sp. PhB186]ROS53138.1 PhnB protein [Rathayibacter sp. PhB185]TCL83654.1 PhnB protein [Rathayibacter sp. PhB192]TCM29247.1 PhnB protein [Rathayibacter sp. PhB179]